MHDVEEGLSILDKVIAPPSDFPLHILYLGQLAGLSAIDDPIEYRHGEENVAAIVLERSESELLRHFLVAPGEEGLAQGAACNGGVVGFNVRFLWLVCHRCRGIVKDIHEGVGVAKVTADKCRLRGAAGTSRVHFCRIAFLMIGN